MAGLKRSRLVVTVTLHSDLENGWRLSSVIADLKPNGNDRTQYAAMRFIRRRADGDIIDLYVNHLVLPSGQLVIKEAPFKIPELVLAEARDEIMTALDKFRAAKVPHGTKSEAWALL